MLEIDSSVSVTFISGDPHFPEEIRASPRCINLSDKRENKKKYLLTEITSNISSFQRATVR